MLDWAMEFTASDVTHRLLPAGPSLTATVLRAGTPPPALVALMAAGTVTAEGMNDVAPDGMPALAAWVAQQPAADGETAGAWNTAAWPVDATGSWGEVALAGEGTAAHAAEWAAGWMLAMAPDGLGRCRWAQAGAAPPSVPSLGLVSLLADRGWARALAQALRRPDAPTGAELDRLELPSARLAHAMRTHPTRERILLPLLHGALADNRLDVAQGLLDAGCDPNGVSADGTPALYRATSPEAVALLMAHGADGQRTPPHGMAVTAWWAATKGSAHQAAPLVEAFQRAQAASMPAAQLWQATMPALATHLATLSLAAIKAQVAQLKIPSTIVWEEAGDTWTWGRRALATALSLPPGPLFPGLEWALQKPLGAPLDSRVANADLLEVLLLDNPKLKRFWARLVETGRIVLPANGAERWDAVTEALADRAFQAPGADTRVAQLSHPAWLVRLGRWRLAQGDAEGALRTWARVPHLPDARADRTNATSKKLSDEGIVALQDALGQAWERARLGDRVGFGRWVGEAVALAAHVRTDFVFPLLNDWTMERAAAAAWPAEHPRGLGVGLARPAVLLGHAQGVALAWGVLLDDGADGARLEAASHRWANTPHLAALAQDLRSTRIAAALDQLPADTPARRGPRL